ncbi:MAG TPA: Crp/Fnr family transcriptional regulator [Candidatus Krumholzibacteria bacterium]|nr:Crp/Fnr family transcriptional regulator [Candidatus Krumholzibacteria bacterium]HRX51880.1 Crp/Fnr family transcriptional regulator [Candidatus Krumholzibacteria bacterium]
MPKPRTPGFLDRLTPAGRELFQARASRVKLRRGAPVLHRGAATSGAYIVLSGRLRVYALGPSGAEATLYTIEPGETCVFALNCLFQDLRYPAWVTAERASTVAVVPGPLFRHLFGTEEAVRDLTVQALSTAVFQLMSELERVHFQRLDHRLINLILLRAQADGVLRMTQQQVADHLGVSRESVARHLRPLVRDGLLSTRRGGLEIVDSATLAARLVTD